MDSATSRRQRSMAGVEDLQANALSKVDLWLEEAATADDARDAANWALAAKNAASVAVSCETIKKLRRERAR